MDEEVWPAGGLGATGDWPLWLRRPWLSSRRQGDIPIWISCGRLGGRGTLRGGWLQSGW